MLEGAEEGMLTDLVKADDGGYLGLLQETGPHDQNGYTEFCEYAVVKFSANGRLLWKNSTAFDGRTDLWIGCLTKYNGMTRIIFMGKICCSLACIARLMLMHMKAGWAV